MTATYVQGDLSSYEQKTLRNARPKKSTYNYDISNVLTCIL